MIKNNKLVDTNLKFLEANHFNTLMLQHFQAKENFDTC